MLNVYKFQMFTNLLRHPSVKHICNVISEIQRTFFPRSHFAEKHKRVKSHNIFFTLAKVDKRAANAMNADSPNHAHEPA